MGDVSRLFYGGGKLVTSLYVGNQSCIYLGWDMYSAITDFIVCRAGTLEVPITFNLPCAEFLPDTMPRYPRKNDLYFTQGGTNFPDRWKVSQSTQASGEELESVFAARRAASNVSREKSED